MNSIEYWHGQIVPEADPSHWQCLSPDELACAATFKNRTLLNRYVIVHSMVRQLLAQKLAVAPETIEFSKAKHGKPYLSDYPELAFNLSHSADRWLFAIGWRCQLGVDIEIAKPRKNLAALVEKCFAKSEADYWHSLPEAEQTTAFYRFWTRKEAFVKATGRGIALGLNRCELSSDKPTEFLSVPEEFAPASIWRVQDLELGYGYCGALALDRDLTNIRRMEVTF